jgi:chromatin assembly factor 1 subunit A
MDFFTCSEDHLSRNADRIRFELSALVEPDGRPGLEYPSTEEWAIFSVTEGGHRLVWGLFSDGQLSDTGNLAADTCPSTALGMEDNFEALHTAIIKLVRENPAGDRSDYCAERDQMPPSEASSLKKRFNQAMSHCHHTSDFMGAHYWWNASRQLLRSVADIPSRLGDDSWILEPMHTSCSRSLRVAHSVIERCETDFVALDRSLWQLQGTVKETIKTITKLRNKMWYMTDVKNSMRYEDARNVALALKTMVYSARLYQPIPANERRTRSSPRASGGSVLQKPELQVMNVMKAPSSQGGPNKLSDEQVELTRKWLAQNNIDNFCKGEERIHRFCYEVKVSINRLVGDTMAEAPVLWASELFQKERVKFEGSSNRSFLGLASSSLRPVGTAGEELLFASQSSAGSLRSSDSFSRYTPDPPPLNRKSSFQSSISDKWRIPRVSSAADGLSIGDSPSKATSVSTGDTYSTFWSVPHQNAPYAASASSFYSRPPSMLSEAVAQPARQKDRKGQGKVAFLNELKQALTSLLLSDLGSPVWSCGSETDAWFGNALDQERIRIQMKKREKIQRFYAECNARKVREITGCSQSRGRRSKSLEPPISGRARESDVTSSVPMSESAQAAEDQSPFSYGVVFRQLIEIFSRHGNPFVKLNALRDLRALVIASLNVDNDDKAYAHADKEHVHSRELGLHGKRAARYSFSESRTLRGAEKDFLQTPTSPAAESVAFDSRPSEYSAPTENQIVDALRSLLLEVKPKTLFRDLQFISAFVPGETLNKTDSGTAFLQFGLAALSLKEEVCNSMVEIADRIVSQELSRRHVPQPFGFNARPSHAIEDAAGMWIITAKEGNPVAQRELAILYLTHPELLPRVTLPLTSPRDTFKAEMMYRRDKDSKSDPQSMCLALHWMQLSANGGDQLARNRLREREEFDSIA